MPSIHGQMPHGANKIINKQNGTKPNQQNWKFLQEIKFSQPNTKITPTLGFMKLKTKSKE